MPSRNLLLALWLAFALTTLSTSTYGQPKAVPSDSIREAFRSTHDGWSVDEVLLDDQRRSLFLKRALQDHPGIEEKTILETLVKLRKSGKLEIESTRRSKESIDEEAMVASEIAARHIQDQLGAGIDQILVDSKVREEFDRIANSIAPDATAYEVRKGAFKLRKARELRPELTLRVTDWKREIQTMSLSEAKDRIASFPKANAVYIFRDTTGYLYIGQTNNLRDRMAKHLTDSDRRSLARYLKEHSDSDIQLEIHLFAADSPAKETMVREAYESELIRSRKPRLNIAP